MKLIGQNICPFVQRVTATLEAKRARYEVEYIDLADKPQWFLDLSPNAQVPVLVTAAGDALFESDAIVEYVDDTEGPLCADLTAETRALERAWSYQASKNYLVQCGAMQSGDADTLAERGAKLATAFAGVERQLGDGDYFAGDALGKVDVAWLPLLHRADIIRRHTDYDFVADHPKVKRWQRNLLVTGLAEKSVPPDFTRAFADFYLSPQTHLGRIAADAPTPPSMQACCEPAQSCCG